MDENTLKLIADQLRKPKGEIGIEVANKMNINNKIINKITLKHLGISPQDNILEIGMGNGFFVKDILSVDDSIIYTGCDHSELMIKEANILNQKFIKDGRANFYLADAENLPFNPESFNKIFTVNTLYFWENPAKIFVDLYRVLKHGGKLLISLRPKKIIENLPFIKYGFILYSLEEIEKFLTENKFAVKNIIEESEPDQNIDGEVIKISTLIVCAEKE